MAVRGQLFGQDRGVQVTAGTSKRDVQVHEVLYGECSRVDRDMDIRGVSHAFCPSFELGESVSHAASSHGASVPPVVEIENRLGAGVVGRREVPLRELDLLCGQQPIGVAHENLRSSLHAQHRHELHQGRRGRGGGSLGLSPHRVHHGKPDLRS